MFACLYQPPAPEDINRGERRERGENICSANAATSAVVCIARDFSPRYECLGEDLVTVDVAGLDRLLGPPRAIADQLRRAAAARGIRVHVAVARTQMAAMALALANPGVTVVSQDGEAGALAPISLGLLETITVRTQRPSHRPHGTPSTIDPKDSAAISAVKRWGIKTFGELAALPDADLVSRLGVQAREWQAIARGEDRRPLIPTLDAERFDASLDLEWPIDGLEPLSFVLTRLLEPISTRLERRDRGAAVLHVLLRLVTRDTHACRLELPSPMRDVRTLRTLALLDLEARPPSAAIDRVTVVIDPTPGRVLQHTLFTRAHPTPEQLSTLLARLGALMGQDRFGAPGILDSYRPGAFAMVPFATDHKGIGDSVQPSELSARIVSALRRCRHPVPARVSVVEGRPTRVTTDRRGFAGGAVVRCVGPWRSSGEWWAERPGGPGGSGRKASSYQAHLIQPAYPAQPHPAQSAHPACWSRDEWDVALNDGAVYRIFQDRDTEAWFIDAIMD